MIRSMTGFGRAELAEAGYQVTCEIRGVNHRFFDFNLRIPRRYASLEDKVREIVKGAVARGRIDVSMNIVKTADLSRELKVDNALAMTYYKSLKDLADFLHLSPDFRVTDVFRMPEVFSLEEAEESLETLWKVMEVAVNQALGELVAMREREGQALTVDILERTASVLASTEAIEERSPQVVKEYAERLKKRIADIAADVNVDEARVAQEVVVFADRSSITEEIVRLKSHCGQMKSLFQSSEAVGRKADFLVQEMFREVNTIASKANDLVISQTAVDLKAELEKIREQLQNIE